MQHIQSKSNNTSHEEQICMSEAKCIFVMSDLDVMHERSEMHDMNNQITSAYLQLIYFTNMLQASCRQATRSLTHIFVRRQAASQICSFVTCAKSFMSDV